MIDADQPFTILAEQVETLARAGYAYAWSLLGHREDAADAVQSALASLWRHRWRLRRGVSPRAWFFRVLRNRCLDMLRRRRVRGQAQPLNGDLPDRRTRGPEDEATRRDELRRLRDALARLEPAQREIILLRDYHGLSYAEIANVLGIPPGTVMSRLHRARMTLRGWMRDDE